MQAAVVFDPLNKSVVIATDDVTLIGHSATVTIGIDQSKVVGAK